LKGALAVADDRPEPREALIAQGIAFVDFARANPALFRLMYSHQYGNADSEMVRATYRILADRVAEILPAQASAATLACRSLVQGMATIVLNGRLAPSTPDDIVIAVQLLVQGLRSRID
jgi:AcrR family transcriptional regulator